MMKTEHVVLAATAAVISGTILFLVSRLKKSLISSASDEKKKKKKKKKKTVHFAPDVTVSPRTRREERTGEVRRNYRVSSETKVQNAGNEENLGMPANRVVLYNAIFRERAARRLAMAEAEESSSP